MWAYARVDVRELTRTCVCTGICIAFYGLAATGGVGAANNSNAAAVEAAAGRIAPAGVKAADSAFYSADFGKTPSVAAMTALGRRLFLDPSLSASGKLACAGCHSPSHSFGPPTRSAVQRGGGDERHSGVRAVPSLMYLQNVPWFTEHYVDDEGDDSVDQGPAGGLTWDGRAQSAHDQARLPLFSAFEMGNVDSNSVVAKVASASYAAQFRETFGDGVFDDAALAFRAVLMALETYQQNPAEFYPYSSKYDAWLRREATLTLEETRGMEVFNDPSRGNCARCHPSAMRAGAFPQFTDFGYAALGLPRNAAIPANADPRHVDLGLCGPLRTDLRDQSRYCGLFRTPSLRNVATRRVFFHNGVVHRLEDAVRFYAERDARPQRWYPRGAGATLLKFDDLPQTYQANVDHGRPFDRQAGDRPALSAAEIEALVAFLGTLTDGYAVSGGSSTGSTPTP